MEVLVLDDWTRRYVTVKASGEAHHEKRCDAIPPTSASEVDGGRVRGAVCRVAAVHALALITRGENVHHASRLRDDGREGNANVGSLWRSRRFRVP